jgi:hypothetical protein
MKDPSKFAFTGEYLCRQEMQFFEDLEIILQIHRSLGQDISDMEKQQMTEEMENRMRACYRCPANILAVWSDEICP